MLLLVPSSPLYSALRRVRLCADEPQSGLALPHSTPAPASCSPRRTPGRHVSVVCLCPLLFSLPLSSRTATLAHRARDTAKEPPPVIEVKNTANLQRASCSDAEAPPPFSFFFWSVPGIRSLPLIPSPVGPSASPLSFRHPATSSLTAVPAGLTRLLLLFFFCFTHPVSLFVFFLPPWQLGSTQYSSFL